MIDVRRNRVRPDLWLPKEKLIIEKLGKYPTVIAEARFNNKGLVVAADGSLRVPAYVGSGLGFNRPGQTYMNGDLYPKLEEMGVYVLDPFAACAEFLSADVFDDVQSVAEQRKKWVTFNETIGLVNYGILMPHAKIMIAIMEGYPPDEGLAAEVAYFSSNHGPVLGVRSDFRLAENPAATANPAITFFMGGPYGGDYFEGPGSYEELFEMTKQLVQEIIQ